MLLFRIGPDGSYAVAERPDGDLQMLHSDPLAVAVENWQLGRPVKREGTVFLPPILPGKIVGIGRNYVEHARGMDNAVPSEPLLFLKAPTSLIGAGAPVVLPLESQRVEYEGEIAVVVRQRLRRASA